MNEFQAGRLVATLIEAMAIQAEIAHMSAVNLEHLIRGRVSVHDDAAFKAKSDLLWGLSNSAWDMAKGG